MLQHSNHFVLQEELGIARRDALPLEDRAANVPMIPLSSINRPVRPEHPTSAWHSKLDV